MAQESEDEEREKGRDSFELGLEVARGTGFTFRRSTELAKCVAGSNVSPEFSSISTGS